MTEADESGGWEQDVPESGRSGSTFGKQNVTQAAKAKAVRDDWDDDDDDEEGEVEAEQVRDVNVPVPASTGPTSVKTRGREGGEEESSKIWQEANRRAPMPELIVAPASTSQWVPAPPPIAALQPTLRILKRPASNASTGQGHVGAAGALSASSPPSPASGPTSRSGSLSGATSPMPRGTLAEREAQYQEARNRIFGEREKEKSGGASASPGSMSRTSSSSGSGGVVIVRDPLGPAVLASEPEIDPDKERVRGSDRSVRGFGERRRGKQTK